MIEMERASAEKQWGFYDSRFHATPTITMETLLFDIVHI